MSAGRQLPRALLVCLTALTTAVTLRQAEHGVLSIFLGVGMGSKMARIFAPLLLVLTFAWEALNTRVAGQPGAALLAAGGVAVGTGILLFFAWRISRMENEIHDLVLRDEATRLYNQRGFHLLAEHALRLAKRTNVPFSVLFVEMENLTEIHSELGPNAAAASLAEAGEILRATFRESDIKGRIGAADFAVAGRFDRAGISIAALRLEAATAARMSKTQGPVPLKLSIGHVTTLDSGLQESLKDLLVRAGQAKNRVELQMSQMLVN
jgi:diguanylate cyclase (GGDEF)-like protein